MLKDVFARCWHTGVKASNNGVPAVGKIAFVFQAFGLRLDEPRKHTPDYWLAVGLRGMIGGWALRVKFVSSPIEFLRPSFGLSGYKQAENQFGRSTCVHMSNFR